MALDTVRTVARSLIGAGQFSEQVKERIIAVKVWLDRLGGMNEDTQGEAITDLRFILSEVHGKPARKHAMTDALGPVVMAGKLHAKETAEGIILTFITTKDGTEFAWGVTQQEADAMRLNAAGEFELF